MRIGAIAATLLFGIGTMSDVATAAPAETEAALNRRGYELLRKGDVAGAIRVFQRNVDENPASANAHDSLAEAYVAAGDTPRAVESYREALALNPRSKSARYALQRLTGERHPLRPLLLFHIAAGMAGLIAGTASMVLRKGSRRHEVAGQAFVVSMVGMGAAATFIASTDPHGDVINVLMGTLTCYLVITGWLTARRRGTVGRFDRFAVAVAAGVAIALVRYGVAAGRGQTGDGVPAAVYFVFAVVAWCAAVGDMRMIARGGISGGRRVARHLWRMGTALFIAAGSFFLGQPQVFPDALRQSPGLRAIPVLLVIASTVLWFLRVRYGAAYAAGRPPGRTALARATA